MNFNFDFPDRDTELCFWGGCLEMQSKRITLLI